jgi:very-short-patch-repair endonuclease
VRRPRKPGRSVKRAKALRRKLTLPEAMLWRHLKGSPNGIRFRKQHPADDYILDFFCARANLAIEVDGMVHDMGDRPARDEARDAWLERHRIATLRIAASEVLADSVAVAEAIVAYVEERMRELGKAPPSDADASATSPSQVDGEDSGEN